MDILLQNVEKTQLPLLRKLAKTLGFSLKERTEKVDDNALQIRAAIDRVESGSAELHTLDWEDFRKMAYGK